MKKLITILLITNSLAASANTLQIREAGAELNSLKKAEYEAETEYRMAKRAYLEVKSARIAQEAALKRLMEANHKQQQAETYSQRFHLYDSEAYSQDQGSARAGITYYSK